MNWQLGGITVTKDEIVSAAIMAGVTFVLAFLAALTVKWLFRVSEKRGRAWGKALAGPTIGLVFWGVLLYGLNQSTDFLHSIAENDRLSHAIDVFCELAWLLFFVVSSVKVINALAGLEIEVGHDKGPSHLNRVTLLRKMGIGVAIVLGAIWILKTLGVDTSPFLAGGALGGVILGLALQQSLSNVFSGILFTWDGEVRLGDLVRLPDGKEGILDNIGWRSTSLRLWDNTLLVVPNSQLASSSLVNMSRPAMVVTVSVDCGVSYDSDLDFVEELVVKIAREIQSKYSEGGALPDPVLRWKTFGDSSVDFRVFMPVGSPFTQYAAQSELVKSIHKQFGEKGVDIPFPIRDVRTVVVDGGGSADASADG